MTRDLILAELKRALEAVDPDRAEAVLAEVERKMPADDHYVPGPESSPQKEALARARIALEAAFPDRAAEIMTALRERVALAAVIAASLPRGGTGYERTEGKGSSRVNLGDDACPKCAMKSGLQYRGSDVIEGSLEHYHLMHTEVEDWFFCSVCNSEWSEGRYL